MKKLMLAATMLISSITYAQEFEVDNSLGSSLLVLPGNTLVYEVNFRGNEYKFYVDVLEFKPDGSRKFNYRMDNANNTSGNVSISADAMNSAIEQFNYFSGGTVNLTNQTTVWISKKVYDDLLNNGNATISTDGGKTTTTIFTESVNYDFSAMNHVSGEKVTNLSYIAASTNDGSVRYWIHGNRNNPLILAMDIGWTIVFLGMQPTE